MKLSKKVTLCFILSILVSILIISVISNYMINNRFENYLESEQSNKFERIYEDINSIYLENYNNLEDMNLIHYTLGKNISLRIKDNDGNIIYTSNNGMGMHRQGMNMMHRIPEGNYEEKSYTLTDGDLNIGTLIIGYIDNSYLTDSALIFKDTLTQSLFASGFFAVIVGILFSIALSKGLTTPLITITNTANKIRNGDLLAKSTVNTNTNEIAELSETINYLGNTLSMQENIRKRYASDISHELRTPLTTLKTHIEAIMDGVWEPTNEHLNILMKEVTRLSKLVDDLKDSFIQDEYTTQINKTKFNISTELENVISVFNPVFLKEDYRLVSSIENNLEVLMDKDKFIQVINNLLSNSLRYLNNNGEVYIELKRIQEDNLRLIIRDNGVGIKEKDLQNIFNRFYRVDTSRNKSTGGSGLGLSIVKSIIENHNGIINIKSEFRKGTEVEIILPLIKSKSK